MSEYDNLEALMSEPPGGYNYGNGSPSEVGERVERAPLDTQAHIRDEFLRQGGWSLAWAGAGEGHGDGGLRTHRGVLAPGEYVDEDLLKSMVEQELGYSSDEITRLYSPAGSRGLNEAQLKRRSLFDAQLLRLSDSGTDLKLFARVLGMSHRTIYHAVKRARTTRQEYWNAMQDLRREQDDDA